MAHSNHYRQDLFVAVAVATVAAFLAVGEASCVGFDLHHRSSPVVRRWAEARGHPPSPRCGRLKACRSTAPPCLAMTTPSSPAAASPAPMASSP
ncbi:hypothetical protein BAE44_0006927 [Dichanthelium oligosanthes]|uniref:Uncharacterized protein n=1 Tax=Dichanthelium oligosanthes TaxID=888268 RepID=A0A1E5W3U3_9POAL|nr:hypothetical protein BAE44_0006927 [Dichanthelium oligosanthes]